MTTTPDKENWEKQKAEIKKEWGIFIQYPDEEHTSNWWFDKIDLILKSRDEALVAEIEKMKEYNSDVYWVGFNEALDTIIRIIQEK